MSSWGKISLLIGGFFLIVLIGARYILGAWIPIFYIFLGIFALSVLVSIVLDYKFYIEFFSMKTTRSGLSLGASLTLLIILLTAIGFLGNRFDKTYDFTEEGINSLAPQSKEALESLEHDLIVRIFYKGDKISPQGQAQKEGLRNAFALYKQTSSQFKVRWVDSYSDNKLAEKYLSRLSDKDQKEIFVFMDYDSKRIRVETPYAEESITSAIIKVKKRTLKEIYFLVGHGEKDLQSEHLAGLNVFKQYLEDSGFILKEWSFVQDGKPKTPPSLMLVIGSRHPFLAEELIWLKSYLKQGGRLFFALDPGEKHNLKPFLRKYGIDYKNNFIVSQLAVLYGGATRALGVYFDKVNPITKRFTNGKDIAFFDLASVIDTVPQATNKFSFSFLVNSLDKSFSAPKLEAELKVGPLSSLPMAIEVTAKPEKEQAEGKEKESKKPNSPQFRLVVFGDSDFLTNKNFYQGVNRDLALNTIVSLLDEEGLITIRPKQPKGTKVTLTRIHRLGLVVTMIALPFIFILMSMWLWYRRRET